MADQNINPILQAFQEQKVSKQNAELMQAQKLVNLYRALYCFDDAFVDKYNQILLASSVEVRRLLTTIMGGGEVRSYFDFLQQRSHPENTGNSNAGGDFKGYLPTPDEDFSEETGFSVSKEQWENMLLQQKALTEQTQTLMQMLQTKKDMPQNALSISQNKNYSDIIEDDL